MFLSHTYRWLKPGGVLVFVIPGDRLAECGQILSSHFRDVRVYLLESPECVLVWSKYSTGVRRQLFLLLDDNYFSLSTTITS
jgi:tRNA1(Val) A37 N6-methylase TrmN6